MSFLTGLRAVHLFLKWLSPVPVQWCNIWVSMLGASPHIYLSVSIVLSIVGLKESGLLRLEVRLPVFGFDQFHVPRTAIKRP